MFSKLVFSESMDSLNENCLNTYEIYNMPIHAPLVVLSACNTGAGKLHSGEGIISLARAFFTTGTKCVVMTLWSVADRSSSHLMNLFYHYLALKETVSDAMQKAKLQYLDHADNINAHPYFWAGYITTGNADIAFEVRKNHTWIYMLSVITGAVLLLLLLWKFRSHSK
jgi:CHAT domain-containing protein